MQSEVKIPVSHGLDGFIGGMWTQKIACNGLMYGRFSLPKNPSTFVLDPYGLSKRFFK